MEPKHETLLEAKLTAIVHWLEKNQPDVFSRGLWDAIIEAETDYKRGINDHNKNAGRIDWPVEQKQGFDR